MPATGLVIAVACALFSLTVSSLTGSQALWIMLGSETFYCDGSHLYLTISVLGIGWTRRFPIGMIVDPRIDVSVHYRRGNQFIQRRVAFDFDARQILSLSLLTEDDLPPVRSYLEAFRESFPGVFERAAPSGPMPIGDPDDDEETSTSDDLPPGGHAEEAP